MDNISEALLVLAVGMGGVFGSLVFFYLVITLLNKIDSYFVKKEERIRAGGLQESKKQADADVVVTQDEADDDELVAVITAAAFAATNKQIIVKKIQFLNQPTSNAWAQAGRLGIMASHNVQKTN